MNGEEFVAAIRRFVLDAAVEDTLKVLHEPPGRRPRPDLVEASEWFSNLTDDDRRIVRGIIGFTAHSAVFGLLCVLDGVRQVEDSQSKGEFELHFVKGDSRRIVNPSDSPMLHDLLYDDDLYIGKKD